MRRMLAVESVPRTIAWTVLAVAAFAWALFSYRHHQLTGSVVGFGAFGLVLLVPPTIGVSRWRVLHRVSRAEAEAGRLREENRRLRASAAKAVRASAVLADWHKNTLLGPYRPRSLDRDRDFESWLNDILVKVMSVVFPDQGTVGIALIAVRAGNYTITHSSAGLPEVILRVAPAPVHRPLEECITRHAPHARIFSFPVHGREAWVAFFPERPFDEAIHGSHMASIAATVAGVYRDQHLLDSAHA